ncbi:tol-like protein [Annulohypoxylon moriforme]|nr:tol-like protein [Annulohypoxylon moriforme]
MYFIGPLGRNRVLRELASMEEYHDLTYTPPVSTDNLSAWVLCRSWIDNCINNHSRCKSLRVDAWWPTRLLYIGSANDDDLDSLKLQLHLTQDKQPYGSYMTLSHCWGDTEEMLKLTSDTYKLRTTEGFSYAELPKTFQDFVRLSRFLHNNYVWIDSLCIIQDSTDDWIRESKTMADVYRHSKCNIAATASRAPTEGCFYIREPTKISPLQVTLRSEHTYLIFRKDLWHENIENAPLNQRSWVLQERMLAPRQIHCGRDQLFWECYETTACETFPFSFEFHEELSMAHGSPLTPELTGLGLMLSEMSKLRLSGVGCDSYLNSRTLHAYADVDLDCNTGRTSRFEGTLKSLEGATPEERFALMRCNVYKYWTNIVQLYSSCGLTRRSDKLVAIFGIVSRIQDVLKDKDDYIAGLWRSQLFWQLAWERNELHEYNDSRPGLLDPSYDIAPSWSWACFNSRIYFREFKPDAVSMVDILDIYDGHGNTAPGAVDNVRESPLKLRCLLYKIYTSEEGPDYVLPRVYSHNDAESVTSEVPKFKLVDGQMIMDSIESSSFWGQAYMLPTMYFDYKIRGMVVTPCQGRPGFYRRIATWGGLPFKELADFARLAQHALSVADEDKVTITII